MNLIEKWKNRETKKKLREENIRLSARNEELKKQLDISFHITRPTNVIREERNIHKLRAQFLVENNNPYQMDFPTEYIKRQIAGSMLDELEKAIEYDFYDTEIGRVYTGTLWVATGDRKFNSQKCWH